MVDKIELMLRDLRALSIRTVELIVLWRDQFRYLALIGSKQRTLRKRRAQTAIQVAYLTAQNENYLIKMKHDTTIFATLAISKYFNFVGEGQRADPFLIQASVSGNIVAGNKIRAIKQRGNDIIKRSLPLGDEDMTKAKACEEMIMYERPVSATANKSGGQVSKRSETSSLYVFPPPSTVVLVEFEKAVTSFIEET